MKKTKQEASKSAPKIRYDKPTLLEYGALRKLTHGGSQDMMEGTGDHAQRMP